MWRGIHASVCRIQINREVYRTLRSAASRFMSTSTWVLFTLMTMHRQTANWSTYMHFIHVSNFDGNRSVCYHSHCTRVTYTVAVFAGWRWQPGSSLMYERYAADSHLPSYLMTESCRPAHAAVVAVQILNCNLIPFGVMASLSESLMYCHDKFVLCER